MSTQEAFDRAGQILKECYLDWYIAQSQLPQTSQAIDYDIHKYIDAVRNIMLANLNWRYGLRHCGVFALADLLQLQV